MTAADELLDAILVEVDRQATARLAARYIRATGDTTKHRWAAERVERVADEDAWRDESPK